ncbi:hypothetical protein Tco_0439395, partial [Tanacetum coccineum]
MDILKMEMEMEIPSVKASANSDVMYSFTSAQDGNPLQDDVRLCLGDDLKKAQDHSQRQATHMDTSEKLMPNNGQAVSQLEYSRVIGCLMYAMTCTRRDIAFVMGRLNRYTSNPITQHWQETQKVLKYLKKTMDYSLTYTGYSLVLKGYTDASCISNTEDNSSTSKK